MNGDSCFLGYIWIILKVQNSIFYTNHLDVYCLFAKTQDWFRDDIRHAKLILKENWYFGLSKRSLNFSLIYKASFVLYNIISRCLHNIIHLYIYHLTFNYKRCKKLLNKQTIWAYYSIRYWRFNYIKLFKIVLFPCMSAILRDCTSVCVSQSSHIHYTYIINEKRQKRQNKSQWTSVVNVNMNKQAAY